MKSLKLQSSIASAFSVAFSMSLVKQLFGNVELPVFVALAVFIVLFLLYNENRKVTELRRKYMSQCANVATMAMTISISVLMSCTGIWFWTNGALENGVKNDNDLQSRITLIEREYRNKVDSAGSVPMDNMEYVRIKGGIEWWQGRRPANLKERAERNAQIAMLQERLGDVYKEHSVKRDLAIGAILGEKEQAIRQARTSHNGESKKMGKSNAISLAFMLMVMFTEFIILNIQREIGRLYYETNSKEIRIIEDIINRGVREITIGDLSHGSFSEGVEFSRIKSLFNLLISMKLMSHVGEKEVSAHRDVNKKYDLYRFRDTSTVVQRLRGYYHKYNSLNELDIN